jgi:hypothetical protein
MKQQFKSITFSPEKMGIVDAACEIIDQYEQQGFKLTLRQLYYQFVARDLFPDGRKWTWTGTKWVRDPEGTPNAEPNYKWLGEVITEARIAGLADWDMIEDRNRETVSQPHWRTPGDILRGAAMSYHVDKWADQPCYCEVMVEKQALEGILEPVCSELDISFTSNKGYSSVTMMYHTGQRLMRHFRQRCEAKGLLPEEFNDQRGMHFNKALIEAKRVERDRPCRLNAKAIKAGYPRIVIFYLGDHDPSGIDMTRDVADRLELFSDFTPIEVHRLALNMPQIEELQPPENPTKMTDSRATAYVAEYGESSWELDAVAPDALAQLVRDAVMGLRDETLWSAAVEREDRGRATLSELADEHDN